MKLKLRNNIFKKRNTVLRLLGCALTSDMSRKRYLDSTNIMKLYR